MRVYIVQFWEKILNSEKKGEFRYVNSQLKEEKNSLWDKKKKKKKSQLPFYLFFYLVEEAGFRCKQTY